MMPSNSFLIPRATQNLFRVGNGTGGELVLKFSSIPERRSVLRAAHPWYAPAILTVKSVQSGCYSETFRSDLAITPACCYWEILTASVRNPRLIVSVSIPPPPQSVIALVPACSPSPGKTIHTKVLAF